MMMQKEKIGFYSIRVNFLLVAIKGPCMVGNKIMFEKQKRCWNSG